MPNEPESEEKVKDEPPRAEVAEDNTEAESGGNGGEEELDRREFMVKAASMVFGGVVVAVPAGAGLVTFFSPLMEEGVGGLKVRLASLADLPEDGTPKRFDVVAERTDAFTKYPAKPLGGVFLRRLADGKVDAFNSSCPHLGCSVIYESDRGSYLCPCHMSQFEIDGSRGEECVSARGLDSLEVDEEKLEQDAEVWVTFVNFKTGVADKIPVS